jgi:adenylosuccinate synthase
MLDIDFWNFPFCNLFQYDIGWVFVPALGVSPKLINEVMGVTKAYCTRVGGGPFPTELSDATGEELRKIGSEFGATTGRPAPLRMDRPGCIEICVYA